MSVEYDWIQGRLVGRTSDLLKECAQLYSSHYGVWGAGSSRDGEPVRLSASRIWTWLTSPDSYIAYAREDGRIVGYAIAITAEMSKGKTVTWVTQLVVHEKKRQQGIAKSLLHALWSFSDHFAWGIVSANPFAVRALEKMTRRRCDPILIAQHRGEILRLATGRVPYVSTASETYIRGNCSRINTEFCVDQSSVGQRITACSSADLPWKLGDLLPGWEWLAFTFIEQQQMNLTISEINKMLATSDQVVRKAYSRMTLTSDHRWMSHTDQEAAFIVQHCGLQPGSAVLDFGCGNGRHAIALSSLGCNVTAVDYVPDSYMKRPKQRPTGIQFIEADCRNVDLGQSFDCVICLYDVIGSFAEQAENFKIIRNISRHLKPGGTALVSVMNWDLTRKNAKHQFSFDVDPSSMLALPPSGTMEQNGNVFNPDYYLIDDGKQVVYRREQFVEGDGLPVEMVVRDRRFSPLEIANLLKAVSLNVEWVRCVRAGDWDTDLDPLNDRAKEILLLCRKPLA